MYTHVLHENLYVVSIRNRLNSCSVHRYGSLRCIDSPTALAARFGGYFMLTITTSSINTLPAVSAKVQEISQGVAKVTYTLGTTQTFEVPSSRVTLSQVFSGIGQSKEELNITDWGIASATLEQSFIRLCNNVQ